MSLFKYIDRIQSIHEMIEKKRTGPSEEFAARLGISRSLLMEHLREMRETFGARIDYCRRRQTFYYEKTFHLQIKIVTEPEEVKGGVDVRYNGTDLLYSEFGLTVIGNYR